MSRERTNRRRPFRPQVQELERREVPSAAQPVGGLIPPPEALASAQVRHDQAPVPKQAKTEKLGVVFWNDTPRPIGFSYRYSPHHPLHHDTIAANEIKPYWFWTSHPDQARFKIQFDCVYGPPYYAINKSLEYARPWPYPHEKGYDFRLAHGEGGCDIKLVETT